MRIYTFFIFVTLILLSLTESRAQISQSLSELENKYYACLDTGVHMSSCSKRYYIQVDSMLNVAYLELSLKIKPAEKDDFIRDQLDWAVKRNEYFEQKRAILRENMGKGEWGKDMEMIFYDDQANFVKKRVEELVDFSNAKR